VQSTKDDPLAAQTIRVIQESAMMSPVALDNAINVDRGCGRIGGDETRVLVIPMLFRDHYVLWIVHKRGSRIEFYDSLAESLSSDEITACVMGLHWFGERLGWWPSTSEIRLVLMCPDPPHQRSSVDCGVFVCMYAHLRVIKGRSPEEIQRQVCQRDADVFRQDIVRCLSASDLQSGFE
jgi:Ulp1 family protease